MSLGKRSLAVVIFLVVIGMVFIIRTNSVETVGQDRLSRGINLINNELFFKEQVMKNKDFVTQDNKINYISLVELGKHDSLEDCWISYDEKVYDITSYLPRHPGSAGKILPFCGTLDEFKTAFEKKHGTSKVKLLMTVGTFIGDFDVVGNVEI
jgi:cytochrome b involved in lipid metabolism